MSSDLATRAASDLRRRDGCARVAFLGAQWSLGVHAPADVSGSSVGRFEAPVDGLAQTLAGLEEFAADAVVVIDPAALPAQALEELRSLRALTLGVLVGGMPEPVAAARVGALDRVVCFDPALTGRALGRSAVWRAVTPPVSDALFGEVRPLRRAPRAMSIGRSSPHREQVLLPSKHHHDLLQVIHGVSGPELAELLRECEVGVHVAAQPGGGFGVQAAIHLAAGHLLLAERLQPAHGLELGIDYLQIDSPGDLEWTLRRLARFPEMYERLRVRGRMKAEQFRASRVFARLLHDLAADVAAFGRGGPQPTPERAHGASASGGVRRRGLRSRRASR